MCVCMRAKKRMLRTEIRHSGQDIDSTTLSAQQTSLCSSWRHTKPSSRETCTSTWSTKMARRISPSAQTIAVPAGYKVKNVRDLVFRRFEEQLLAVIMSSDFSVVESRQALMSGDDPLPLELTLKALHGVSEDDCFCVVCPYRFLKSEVARRRRQTFAGPMEHEQLRDVWFNLVNENGDPLVDAVQCVSLPSSCRVFEFQEMVVQHAQRILTPEACRADLTVYESDKSLYWGESTIDSAINLNECEGKEATECLAVVIRSRALKDPVLTLEVFYQVYNDWGKQVLDRPMSVMIPIRPRLYQFRNAVFDQIRHHLISDASSKYLEVFRSVRHLESGDKALVLFQDMCVRYGRSNKTCLVVHVPNCALKGYLPKGVITYKLLDEAGASLLEEETYLVMSSWARVVHFRDAVFDRIRSHLAESAGPDDLTVFRDFDAFIWGWTSRTYDENCDATLEEI